MTSRRQFVIKVLPAAAAFAGMSGNLLAQPAKLEESDPIAQALGYKHDATKVDKAKFPTWAADRKCNNCQLYAGKATDAWAACAAVGNKQVAGAGWCSAWVKKAG